MIYLNVRLNYSKTIKKSFLHAFMNGGAAISFNNNFYRKYARINKKLK
jgi:hypothetical protein